LIHASERAPDDDVARSTSSTETRPEVTPAPAEVDVASPAIAQLPEGEARYARAARAANTLRGYRSDWREFTTWCDRHDLEPMPAAPAALTAYLTALAGAGASVGTMSRRLSSIRFAHAARDLPDPTATARVQTVWEGIRRVHGAPPDQAKPLMPPELLDVLDACPTTRTWKTRGRPTEPDLAGARDRALLLVGFVGALRRSELVALDVEDVAKHANALGWRWWGRSSRTGPGCTSGGRCR
jgi:integrase